jgi:hypothetical protein
MYTVFALYSSFFPLSLPPLLPLVLTTPPRLQDLFHPPVLQSCKRKRKNDIFVYL